MTQGRASASLLLIHGAGSGPWIFESWYRWFPEMEVRAVDLQENLDVARARMADYAAVVVEATRRLPSPVALCGWSMGGLVAMLACQQLRPHHLIVIEPSAPAEIQGVHPEVKLVSGLFNPEEQYGQFPPDLPARAESSRARAERKRGISVPSVLYSTLVIYGREFPNERGRDVARLYGSAELQFPDLDHWGLITDDRVPRAIKRYLART
ncbi:MAG TPA: alpha/beta hydrolase [Chloroflexota bacterium]|nr:alpha/beta hydrolase [Chloroflexota bacterium]